MLELILGTFVALALGLLLRLVVSSSLGRLNRTAKCEIRLRAPGQNDEDWLLGPVQKPCCQTGAITGLEVRCSSSSAALSVWRADFPPKLAQEGASYFGGRLGGITSALLPDLVVWPECVRIKARPKEVWSVLLDFESYSEWNPFHRAVDVVQQEDGRVALRMQVAMGLLIGQITSVETIFYVDSKRHILVYGIGREGPTSLRVVWLLPSYGGKATWFHSYDVIGGYPAFFSRWYIEGIVHRGFTAQHHALRKRVHQLHGVEPEDGTFAAATKAKAS